LIDCISLFCLIPYLCIIHEDAVIDPTKADCVRVGSLERTFILGEEVAKGRKPFSNCMRKKPSGFGKSSEANPCRKLSPLDCYRDRFVSSDMLSKALE
jgi:hypothetical protein